MGVWYNRSLNGEIDGYPNKPYEPYEPALKVCKDSDEADKLLNHYITLRHTMTTEKSVVETLKQEILVLHTKIEESQDMTRYWYGKWYEAVEKEAKEAEEAEEELLEVLETLKQEILVLHTKIEESQDMTRYWCDKYRDYNEKTF